MLVYLPDPCGSGMPRGVHPAIPTAIEGSWAPGPLNSVQIPSSIHMYIYSCASGHREIYTILYTHSKADHWYGSDRRPRRRGGPGPLGPSSTPRARHLALLCITSQNEIPSWSLRVRSRPCPTPRSRPFRPTLRRLRARPLHAGDVSRDIVQAGREKAANISSEYASGKYTLRSEANGRPRRYPPRGICSSCGLLVPE